LDEWQDQVAVFSPNVSLLSGAHELRVEHYENLEWAKVGLRWEQISGDPTPAGWVTSPPSGSVVDDCPLMIEAQVDPGLGPPERVEFYAHYRGGWHRLGEDRDAPFTQVWDCNPVVDRRASLLVHVWDGNGQEYVDPAGTVSLELAHRQLFHLPVILKARDVGS
jgi:hypothetical protein